LLLAKGYAMTDRRIPIHRTRAGIIGIITALTAFIVAATPGYLALRDTTGSEAKKQATLSEKKTDKTYELLRQKIEFQDAEIRRLNDNDRIIFSAVMSGQLKAAEMVVESPVRRVERSSVRRPRMASRRPSAALDIPVALTEEAASEAMEELGIKEAPSMQIQQKQQLPADLNDALGM